MEKNNAGGKVEKQKRKYTKLKIVKKQKTPCRHCGVPDNFVKVNQYPNGRWRVQCKSCGGVFICDYC